MENKLKTTPNQAVQTYITYGNQKGNRQLKEERLKQLETALATQGIYPGPKVQRVLEKIVYDLTYNGIVKVRRAHLIKKLGVGLNTISTAFQYLAQSKLFILSRNQSGKTNNGCRVIVDVQHTNFDSILREIYHLTTFEIECVKEIFKRQSKHQDLVENAVLPTPNNANSVSNNSNQNKSLKDIKTSTTQASDKKNNLYYRLKTLYQARTGSLEGFKQFVSVIYGSMKKIKAEGHLSLSHMQLESILYQSLDAAISASDSYVKTNRFALLSAIIKRKIEDVTKPQKQAMRRVEVVPAWFATRQNQAAKPTEEETSFFAKERERILAKLAVVQ